MVEKVEKVDEVVTFEKYFDTQHQLPFYYNVVTQESLWELPTGDHVRVVDKTEPEKSDDKQTKENSQTEVKNEKARQI